MTKKLSGNEHVPTEATRAEVVALATFGTDQESIAVYMDMDPKTLRKHYRRELDISKIKANMTVAKSLFRNATENENVSAQIFWLKTQARWKEPENTTELRVDEKISNIKIEVVNASND